MPANLIEMFSNTVGDELVKPASSMLGESAQSTASAIRSVVASLLGTLVEKGGTDAGVKSLLDFIAENNINGSMLRNINHLMSDPHEMESIMSRGSAILSYLAGDKLAKAVDIVAAGSSLKTSSSSSMFKLVAPLLMAVLGKYTQDKSLDTMGVKNLILGQRKFINQALPAGMIEALHIGHLFEPGPASTSSHIGTTHSPAEGNMLSKLLPWIVLLLSALGLFYFVQKGCNGKHDGAPKEMNMTKDSLNTTTIRDSLKSDSSGMTNPDSAR